MIASQQQVVAILEDNAERQQAMRSAIANALPDATCIFFKSAHAIIEWLKTNLDSVSLMSLDHDLEFLPGSEGLLIDPGDGRDVAQSLAPRKPCCTVIVHTSNSMAASSMMFTLQDAGWQVERVLPRSDLAWIDWGWKATVLPLVAGNPSHLTIDEVLSRYANGQRLFCGIDIDGGQQSFHGAMLDDANFGESFIFADFSGASLKRASFRRANVKTCDFRNADLREADFSEAALCSTQFAGATMTNAKFQGAYCHSYTLGADEQPDW